MPMSDDFETPFELLQAYRDKDLKGWYIDEEAEDKFFSSQRHHYADTSAIKGSGKGKRSLLWRYTTQLDPKCYAGAQKTGDCVSWGSRNARDTTRACQILAKKRPESWFRSGATEPTYGARGHGGQGMNPATASMFERDVGFLYRTNYEGVCDLTEYNVSLGIGWGRRGVPDAVKKLCSEQKVGTITKARTQEDVEDLLFNGYGIHSGQSAGWEAGSNKRGIHGRSGSWNHDMATVGYDSTLEFFPFPVRMIMNSWGAWNQKPKGWPDNAYGPWIPGMILTSADDYEVCVSSGSCWAYGDVDGYPPQLLPDYGTIGLLSTDT